MCGCLRVPPPPSCWSHGRARDPVQCSLLVLHSRDRKEGMRRRQGAHPPENPQTVVQLGIHRQWVKEKHKPHITVLLMYLCVYYEAHSGLKMCSEYVFKHRYRFIILVDTVLIDQSRNFFFISVTTVTSFSTLSLNMASFMQSTWNQD